MKVFSKKISDLDSEDSSGAMERITSANGRTKKETVSVVSIIQTVKSKMEFGRMEKLWTSKLMKKKILESLINLNLEVDLILINIIKELYDLKIYFL